MLKWKDCISDADKWAYHAEVYAFRRLRLGTPSEEQSSPCDPDGHWFNEDLIRVAAAKMTKHHNLTRDADLIKEGRTITNTWARDNGYTDFDNALANGRTYTEVVTHVMATASDKLQSRRSPTVTHLAAE